MGLLKLACYKACNEQKTNDSGERDNTFRDSSAGEYRESSSVEGDRLVSQRAYIGATGLLEEMAFSGGTSIMYWM